MRPTRLTLRDFKSHAHNDVDLSTVHVGAITGANGSGKSTLLDALLYAPFGAGALGLAQQADAVVREGATEAIVELYFTLETGRYRITRSRKVTSGGKTDLRIDEHVDEVWVSRSAQTIADTQLVIEELLGANAETFLTSAFVAQGDASRMSKATPKERKDILSEALDLGRYAGFAETVRRVGAVDQAAYDSAAARSDDLTRQIEEIGTVESISTALGNVRTLVAAADTARPALTTTVEASTKAVEDARVAAASGDAARQRVTDLTTHVTTLQDARTAAEGDLATKRAALAANEAAAAKLDELVASQPDPVDLVPLEAALVDARNAHDTAKHTAVLAATAVTEQQAAAVAAENAQKDANRLEQVSVAASDALVKARDEPTSCCPTCEQALDAEARATTVATLDAAQRAAHDVYADAAQIASGLAARVGDPVELIQARAAADDAVSTAASTVTASTAAVDGARAANERRQAIETQIAGARAAGEQRVMLTEAVTTAETSLQSATTTWEKATAELTEAKLNIADDGAASRITQLTGARDAAVQALAEHDEQRARLADAIPRGETKLEQAQRVAEQLTSTQSVLAPLEASIERTTVLSRAFGRDGIPKQVMELARPQIEADVNATLGELGAPFRMRLDLERATKAGTTRDALDLAILADGHERSFDGLSGGEQYRVNLALRGAIAEILASRSGRKIDLLVLDEPEGLDAAGMSMLADHLNVLRRKFGLILTVSHTDGLQAACDTELHVDKSDGTSRVTVAA
jgi:DNA repair exonuclease SbcCD ATPase subunit